LGLTGFLTSTELREAGYASNNGLRDQANALRWVKKYIGGFGGDAGNVTYIGESAGSGIILPMFKSPPLSHKQSADKNL
jgi:carboxylesterase type B